jgi:magnesium-protoporphyrin O-methyltransferase
VYASDISEAMVVEAGERAKTAGVKNINFEAKDLESLSGTYDIVTCIDVMIHYPTEKVLSGNVSPPHGRCVTSVCMQMATMVSHLASLSKDRLIISFAPKTFWYIILKKIGTYPAPALCVAA